MKNAYAKEQAELRRQLLNYGAPVHLPRPPGGLRAARGALPQRQGARHGQKIQSGTDRRITCLTIMTSRRGM